MKKRIMFISLASGGGGAERVMTYLSNAFSEANNEVVYASIYDTGYYCLNNNIDKVVFNREKNLGALQQIKAMRNYIKNAKLDCIIAFDYPICIKLAIAMLGIKAPKLVIMSERNDPASNIQQSWKRKLREWAYGRADKMVFQTDDAKAFFSRKIQKNGIVIPNPLVFEKELPEAINSSSKRIIAVGRITAQKNFSMLINAFNLFLKKHNEYELCIYGAEDATDEKKQLLTLVNNLNINEKVKFEGFSSDILSEMANSCMYVSSSIYEGISNAMLEAMAIGLPVVCTDCPCGGARMMIKNNINGILVSTNDFEEMERAMCKIVESKEFANQLSVNAKEIKEVLDINVIVNEWIQIVEN